VKDDTRRYIRLKKAPMPLPAFADLHRQKDDLRIFADHHSLIVCYRAELPRINSVWPTEVMVQFVGFRKYEHSSLGRKDFAKPKHGATLKLAEGRKGITFAADFQGSRLRVTAERYRAYAIHESEFDIDDRELIPADSLVAKRAYWEHQLHDVHFPVFDKVTPENKERVWQRIQEQYLFRYSRFLRVEADWSGSGIWGISFPGSYGTSPNYDYDCFKLPKSVVRRFEKWTQLYSSRDPFDSAKNAGFDWSAYHREGEWLARELKKIVEADTYVEYHPGELADGRRCARF
jgi:hypothetical protein